MSEDVASLQQPYRGYFSELLRIREKHARLCGIMNAERS